MSTTITRNPALNLTPKEWDRFCRKNHIRKISLFGSALRGDMHAESDIDLLVEFLPDREPGLIDLANMEIELKERFGREVDIRTPEDLSRFFRDEVIASAEVLYEEK